MKFFYVLERRHDRSFNGNRSAAIAERRFEAPVLHRFHRIAIEFRLKLADHMNVLWNAVRIDRDAQKTAAAFQ